MYVLMQCPCGYTYNYMIKQKDLFILLFWGRKKQLRTYGVLLIYVGTGKMNAITENNITSSYLLEYQTLLQV